jgi:hypothetical protein
MTRTLAPRVNVPLRTYEPGDGADARHLEQLAHLGLGEDDLALLGLEHPLEGRADVVHRLVDDAVELDVDALALGGRARLGVGRTWKPMMIAPPPWRAGCRPR